MRLHILSDLHIEFADFEPPQTGADVVVLAGDIGLGEEGHSWIKAAFPNTPVIYVLGNHEFYHEALPGLTHELQKQSAGSRIHLLENTAVEIQGLTFLGCTLWSDFKLLGNEVLARLAAEEIMSDYHLIRLSAESKRLTAQDTARLHSDSVAWLKHQLARLDPERTVVVTHHAPSSRSIPPWHKDEILNAAFASDLEPLIQAGGMPLWIHGHTHYCVDYRIGGTRIISNQRGYPDEPVPGFDPGLVVELPFSGR